MTETIAPEGPVRNLFDSIIESIIIKNITSKNVKAVVFRLIENGEEIARTTQTAIDDYTLGLLKRELDVNWGPWYNWIAEKVGLVAVPESCDEFGDNVYKLSGSCADSTKVPESVTPGISAELILTVISILIPYIVKWMKKS